MDSDQTTDCDWTTECDWKEGLPSALRFGAIRGTAFGIETADRHSFFTLAPQRHGARILDDVTLRNGPESGERHLQVEMAEGCWNARIASELGERHINFSASLNTLSPSLFQDFVLRTVFSKDSFSEARIAGEIFAHGDSDIYHQHPVREAVLSGSHGKARIRVTGAAHGPAFRQMLYIRDAPEGWVVHARLIPDAPYAALWVRWFNRFGRISLSDRASRLLLAVPGLKRALWYAAERGGRDAWQLQASGLAELSAGETLSLSMEIAFDPA